MSNVHTLHRRFGVAIAAAVLALAGATAADAMKLKPQNLTQLIAESDSIIAGTVTRVTDGVTESGMPFTEITIAVGDSAKGSIGKNTTYTFRQFGLLKPRKMPNGKTLIAVAPEGFARWTEGEQVVAFLFTPAQMTGLQTTAGMAQGKLTMMGGKLVNEFANAGLFDGVEVDEGLLSAAEKAMLEGAGPVDANVFMHLVGRAVAGNWVENGEMR